MEDSVVPCTTTSCANNELFELQLQQFLQKEIQSLRVQKQILEKGRQAVVQLHQVLDQKEELMKERINDLKSLTDALNDIKNPKPPIVEQENLTKKVSSALNRKKFKPVVAQDRRGRPGKRVIWEDRNGNVRMYNSLKHAARDLRVSYRSLQSALKRGGWANHPNCPDHVRGSKVATP